MNYQIPDFGNDRDQLFDWLKENKGLLISQKKAAMKKADGFGASLQKDVYTKPDTNKEIGLIASNPKDIQVKCVINSTNIIDSHKDMHVSKLWNRSLKAVRNTLHLQEHKMQFDYVLAQGLNEVKAYNTTMSWKSLGYDFEGKTELLMHDTLLKQYTEPKAYEVNKAAMYERYMSGNVTNHSVGMIYVELAFCVDSEDKFYREEKDNWDKYIEMCVNPEAASDGFFWAVTEAKYIEGSSVVMGSNWATPTQSITNSKEFGSSTSLENTVESVQATQRIDFAKLAKAKIFNN